MIEVEKKFILNEQEKERLTKDAQFLGKRIFTDIYFDNGIYALTSKDKWLRSRDGKFELKISRRERENSTVDSYEELTDENEIRAVLGLPADGNFIDCLTTAGYLPFCICETTRQKYKKESFIIDLDSADFQDFIYDIGEIELLVGQQSEIESAIGRIMAFANEQNLNTASVRGKIIEFLKRVKPDHYRVLVEAGVVKEPAYENYDLR